MGMFQVRVRVSNPSERSRFFDEHFWVDTGALYSFIPEGRLNEIGIRPLRTRELILADGRRDRRSLGEAVLTIPQLDESLTCPVIFAPADSLYLRYPGRVQRKNALHADATRNSSDGDGFGNPGSFSLDYIPFKDLYPLLFTLDDTDMNPEGITRSENRKVVFKPFSGDGS